MGYPQNKNISKLFILTIEESYRNIISNAYLYNRGKRIIEKRLEVSIINADIPLLMGYPQNKKTRNIFL